MKKKGRRRRRREREEEDEKGRKKKRMESEPPLDLVVGFAHGCRKFVLAHFKLCAS